MRPKYLIEVSRSLGSPVDTERLGVCFSLPPAPPFSIPPLEQAPSSLSFSLLGAQILANVFLYLCAIVVGIMSYYMADRKHRKAFLEARQSLEVKMNLEEQSQQQVWFRPPEAPPGWPWGSLEGGGPGAVAPSAPWGLQFTCQGQVGRLLPSEGSS